MLGECSSVLRTNDNDLYSQDLKPLVVTTQLRQMLAAERSEEPAVKDQEDPAALPKA